MSIRRFLIAVSSIINIMPATNYKKLISSKSDNEKIRNDIATISQDTVNALNKNRASKRTTLLNNIK
ncbi:hypothetical protein TI10_22500 [Photorhabdus luminescens subsp. luminescens]|uniref:Uncharacterized protein n=1 Tax=Photorhabdus luminescens TaxID=29488 RepID=A0A1G5RJ71_PHOLU|nr:hypothetical protein [Photorhabdus luminescens]KMW71165.1 hypothetical protein TI10_22500 [Photorhabdus luminescens subsp. luminescens]SCZ74087.1 hypothetical protein SAMN02982990_04531 [Photorhabdus luminescens]